jgi:hypothetical protein
VNKVVTAMPSIFTTVSEDAQHCHLFAITHTCSSFRVHLHKMQRTGNDAAYKMQRTGNDVALNIFNLE